MVVFPFQFLLLKLVFLLNYYMQIYGRLLFLVSSISNFTPSNLIIVRIIHGLFLFAKSLMSPTFLLKLNLIPMLNLFSLIMEVNFKIIDFFLSFPKMVLFLTSHVRTFLRGMVMPSVSYALSPSCFSSLIFQASRPLSYRIEALNFATLLVNILPTSRLPHLMPFEALFHRTPDYSHLCVFGCLCYPNLTATSSLKLAHRSTPCLFLGYPLSHQGFWCPDLSSGKLIIYCDVVFDEFVFHYSSPTPVVPPAPLDE